MSKIDELVEIFNREAKLPSIRKADIAGIAAVVRAVRDEVLPNRDTSHDIDAESVWTKFNEILGSDAGNEKVAGVIGLDPVGAGLSPASGQAPATDPAPAVCEWAWERPSATSYYGWYRTSHGERTRNFGLGGKCIACGLPIKFTEAKS